MAELFSRANYAGATDEEIKAYQMTQAAAQEASASVSAFGAESEAVLIEEAQENTANEAETETEEIAWTRANYSGSPGDLAERNAQMLAGRKAMNMAAVSENAQATTTANTTTAATTPLAAWGQRRPTLSCDTSLVPNDDDEEATPEEENPPPYENYEPLPSGPEEGSESQQRGQEEPQKQQSRDTSKISVSIWNMAKALCPSQLELLFAFVARLMTSLLGKRRATVPA
ncbi:hypothetical protein VHEMI07209 [[Torrubiella] hemipterigena]|uniref:Uncharacterized protein n=1 Tax=[Torrubiella] hemipterigena TaxID=1531966 RepID=A0A0A1TKY5_9HYPO|nr:hypothetical protein VHEMI07209 [[Torrubiella] hemipterigena]